ncbi:pyridoxamine 5'-phosphate oxidase family protein [Isosphaeraceae bacterium EP7]
MNTRRFQRPLTSVAELEALIGTPGELVLKKQLAELDGFMATFIEESPFLLLGTFGREGRCDVSPRGDGFGLAKVLDPKTIVIPDRRGNRRADSLRNILETGRVGLLFLIPGRGETLRVNGAACLICDDDVLAPLAADGKVPLVGIAVDVEECYFQCAKAILRSGLWNPRDGDQPSSLPCLAEILVEQTKIEGQTVESLNQLIEDSYANNLY